MEKMMSLGACVKIMDKDGRSLLSLTDHYADKIYILHRHPKTNLKEDIK